MISAHLPIKIITRSMLVLLTLSVLAPTFSFAQTGNDFISSTYNGKNLIINTKNGYIEITPYTADVINVTYKHQLSDVVKSYSTVGEPTGVKAVYINGKSFAGIKTSALKVLVDKGDLSVSFIDNQNHLLSKAFNYAKTGDSSAVSFKSDGKEAFYGGGSKAIYLNRRGTVLQNNNQAHYDYSFGQTDINISIPFMVSNRGYGLYLDNAAESSFDVCKMDAKVLGYKTTSGLVSFYFVGGQNMDAILKNYTFLTGRQPLPPRWSMGYISSRYGYKSEREITNVVNKTRAAGIPIDAVVFDLYWYKAAEFMGNYNWAPDSFPDPKRMLANLLKNHIKVVTISETYITKKSENYKSAVDQHLFATDITKKGSPYFFEKFWAGPSSLLDVFKPSAQQFYWNFYKARIKEGTAGWWFDLGEPEVNSDSLVYTAGTNKQVHNAYALTWAKFAFDGYRKDFPESRILLLPRSGFAGMQRYSTFPWSGDIDRSFAGLKAQIPIIISMGLNGVGYMHSDAGGFTSGDDKPNKDPELYSRWLEFAAFTPVMRTHAGAVHYSPEPIYWDDTTRLRVTKFIKLRYAMLPYNYTLAYKNTTTGRPLVLGVNYFEPEDQRLSNINDEYLWGDEMLVAPVIVKGQTTKKVLFPKGEWIGFNDHKSYKDSADVYAPIDSLPLFVKAGSIIPMAGSYTYTEQYDGKSIILKYYMGKSSATTTSQWFYDDGKDPNSLKNGKCDLVNFTTSGKGKTHTITIAPKHLISRTKNFKLIIADEQFESVSFSNKTAYAIAVNANGDKEIDFKWNGRPLVLSVKTL
ncbi:TIM-barrel domain-containing protein [Mucilaginibacter sp. L196]|uniref:glycoside hydrolase family 31 protein n=1 Tax=Mucilaginibacter sp. L196 TaxID=1641870 RepID=UPI00131A7F38|nr:TIM-barrel domain-containing protein [Mucilaginibacter sp. L196]